MLHISGVVKTPFILQWVYVRGVGEKLFVVAKCFVLGEKKL